MKNIVKKSFEELSKEIEIDKKIDTVKDAMNSLKIREARVKRTVAENKEYAKNLGSKYESDQMQAIILGEHFEKNIIQTIDELLLLQEIYVNNVGASVVLSKINKSLIELNRIYNRGYDIHYFPYQEKDVLNHN